MLFVAGGKVAVITAGHNKKTRDVTLANCDGAAVVVVVGGGEGGGSGRGGAAEVERAAALTQLTADCFLL